MSKIDDQWQANLVDMQNLSSVNKKYNYILTVIDIFSKFAWAIPIKRKQVKKFNNESNFSQETVTIHTGKGLEFINKPMQNVFQKLGINWFATENETKVQGVEKFNRTLK